MSNVYEGIQLTKAQTEAICLTLFDLAKVDGVDEREMSLIEDFWQGSGGEMEELRALLKRPFDLDGAVAVVKGGGEKVIDAFFMSCYLLIFADGVFSEEEQVRVNDYGKAVFGDIAQLEKYDLQARLFLLSNFSVGLRNKDAIRQAGLMLGLTEEQIASVMED
ncbi:hypothetical protein KKF91_16700 [Myxococcota bacterium]|nr:hypothetical protein [Myxococcota bacterium]MBU1432177.1 hypothetical protein [Myxococcota bacterium]MBU1899208.1 hypothetical protein [Myxococcota bacterium]